MALVVPGLGPACAGCPSPPSDAGMTGPDDDGGAEPDTPPPDAGADAGGLWPDAGPIVLFPDADDPPELIEYPPGTLGGACEADADCDTGLCSGALGDRFCSAACTDDAECDPGNGALWSCRYLGTNRICVPHCLDERWCQETAICVAELDLPEGTFSLCFDYGTSQCTADDDCGSSQFCNVVGGGYDLIAHCAGNDSSGFLRGGDTCEPAFLSNVIPCSPTGGCPGGTFCNSLGKCQVFQTLWCASGRCWPQGTCGSPCEVNADCPEGNRCRRVLYGAGRGTDTPDDDGYTFFNLCVPFEGTEDACATDADCTGGELCTYRHAPEGVLDHVCRLPDEGAVTAGERCGDDPFTLDVREPPVPCDSNLCNPDGLCVHACQTAEDCGDPASWQCVGDAVAAFYGDATGICLPGPPCDQTSDCSPGEVCALAGGTDGEIGRCAPAEGTLPPGTPCDETAAFEPRTPCRLDVDCAGVRPSWICDQHTFTCAPPRTERCTLGFCADEGYCPERCSADDDCGHPTLACRGTEVPLFGNYTGDPRDDLVDVVATCRFLPGSRAACARETDCTDDDESCVLSFTSGGSLETLCSAVRPEGAEAGGDCGVVDGEVVFCRSGLCDYDDGRDQAGVGTCAEVCVSTADCPQGLECAPMPVGHRRDLVVNACRRP